MFSEGRLPVGGMTSSLDICRCFVLLAKLMSVLEKDVQIYLSGSWSLQEEAVASADKVYATCSDLRSE
jgi:hypothetical protein